jgi:hypothetical protein
MIGMQPTTRDAAHVERLAAQVRDLVQELREQVLLAEEPATRALLETSAEVTSGLLMAFHHYLEASDLT